MLAPTLPDLSKLDREALQTLLLSEHHERIATQEKLLRRETEIEQAAAEPVAADAVWAQERETGAADRTAGTAAGRFATSASCGADNAVGRASCERTFPTHDPGETGAAAVARAPATTNPDAYAETVGLSRLRRRVTQAGRRCFRDVGVRAGLLSGDPSCAAEAELSAMRTDRAGTGAEPADCARTGGTGSAGACAGFEVWRSSPPLPTMRDL